MFPTSLQSAYNAPSIVRLGVRHVQVTEIDEDRNVAIRPESKLLFTVLCRNRSLLFSAARFAEVSLGGTKPRYDRKGTVYSQKTTTIRKLTKSPLKIGRSGGSSDVKQDTVMDETKRTASATPREAWGLKRTS